MKLSELVTQHVFESCEYDLDRFATPTMDPRVVTEEVIKCLVYTLAIDPDARSLFNMMVRQTEVCDRMGE